MATVHELWLEDRPAGLAVGIGESAPRIYWTTDSGTLQSAYELETILADGTVTSTGKVASANSRLVPWPAKPLQSRDSGMLRVRVWGADDDLSKWSRPLAFEAGLLRERDWRADFVSPSTAEPADRPRPGYLLRAAFRVEQPLARARIYATAHGVYQLEVNGRDTSDDLLSPGWSSYDHRIRYQTHDVTELVTQGDNVVGAWLADGWYRGRLGFNGGVWDNYGAEVALLAQLELTAPDGSVTLIPLEKEWRWSEGPIISAGLYEGEEFDARESPIGWSRPGFDASGWHPVTVLPRSGFAAALEAPTGPPVRVTDRLAPQRVERRPNGRIRLDFGQNIAGKLEIKVRAPRGHRVLLHHAEELENDELAVRTLRTAASIDTYVCRGEEETETWTPRFTLHGFRYAELENWPGEFDSTSVTALVVHSDLKRTGWFDSSNALLNKLHDNVVWSMRGNFVDLPTDCPQRDERLGWTGDIQVFAPTASFLYSVHGMLKGWLRDVAAEQREWGSVPNFVPWVECGFPSNPAAAWGDAAVIVPWVLYERYGDIDVLEAQYPSMKAWVDQVDSLSDDGGLWNAGFQLGDWLDPETPPDDPAASRTDKYLVATAYRIHSTRLLARTAAILGNEGDRTFYEAMARRATDAFRNEFVTPNGRLASDTPTAYSIAIMFELLHPEQRAKAGARLTELVAQSGYRISTGFVGTPIICDALVATGSTDVAYHLLLQEECPSWLYPVTMGATTIWERWDSMLPDGSVNPGEMTSFNHYALGAVADFLHRIVAGLAPASPGYATLKIAPHPGGGLSSASARHLTPHGMASSSWTRTGTDFRLEVTVPPGCTAAVTLPGQASSKSITIGSGTHVLTATMRPAEQDPPIPLPFNIHSPSDRAARNAAA